MSQHHDHEQQGHENDKASKWEKMHTEAEQEQTAEPVEHGDAPLSHEAWQKRYDSLVEEADTLKNQMLGAKAELQNIRRRSERDVEQAHRYGTRKMLQDLLPVLDSCDISLPRCNQFSSQRRQSIKVPYALVVRDGEFLISGSVSVRAVDGISFPCQLRDLQPLNDVTSENKAQLEALVRAATALTSDQGAAAGKPGGARLKAKQQSAIPKVVTANKEPQLHIGAAQK